MPPTAFVDLPTPGTAAPAPRSAVTARPGRLGLGLLVALVVGSIIGSGIFGLPQNMAAGDRKSVV